MGTKDPQETTDSLGSAVEESVGTDEQTELDAPMEAGEGTESKTVEEPEPEASVDEPLVNDSTSAQIIESAEGQVEENGSVTKGPLTTGE